MARIQPSLTKAECELVDKVAELTQTKRTEVIKNALAVYNWFVTQVITGAKIVARKPTGDELSLETPELAALEGKGSKLSAKELRLLGKELAETTDPAQAARRDS